MNIQMQGHSLNTHTGPQVARMAGFLIVEQQVYPLVISLYLSTWTCVEEALLL